MDFERLKRNIFAALTPPELRLLKGRIAQNNGLVTRRGEEGERLLDNHRLSAYGRIDDRLETGVISAEQAEREKAKWDVMHGY